MELSTRELASISTLIVIVVLSFVLSKNRQSIWNELANFIKTFFAWKVWSVLLVFFLYSIAIVLLAFWLGLWATALLKDTIIVVLFTGTPLLVASMSKKSGGELIRHLVKEVLGVTVFLIAYLNLVPFALWGELLLQFAAVLLMMCATVGRRDPKIRSVASACDFLLGIVGIVIFIYTTWFVFTNMNTFNWAQEGQVLALSIWLPLLLVPIVYPIGFIAASETALLHLRFGSGKKKITRRVQFALVAGFHGRLRFASRFRSDWGGEVAKENSYGGARRVMREYRKAVRQAAIDVRRKRRCAKNMIGVHGVDENGYWQDRREFEATKDALTSLFYIQMGFARNHEGRFSGNPLSLVLESELKKLPEPHGIHVRTGRNRKSWFAWRKTAGGFYLAIGGTANKIIEEWQYAGASAPADFPGETGRGWYALGAVSDQPDEWEENDRELPDVISPDDWRLMAADKSLSH